MLPAAPSVASISDNRWPASPIMISNSLKSGKGSSIDIFCAPWRSDDSKINSRIRYDGIAQIRLAWGELGACSRKIEFKIIKIAAPNGLQKFSGAPIVIVCDAFHVDNRAGWINFKQS